MNLNILVFPCGSEIGLEIHAALRYAKNITLYGASSVSDHGEFVFEHYREISENIGSVDFVERIEQLIQEWSIDLVLPAHDSAIPILASAEGRLSAKLAVPPADVAWVCRDKHLTYDRFEPLGIVPRRVRGLSCQYPIFSKPAIGQGAQGTEIVWDEVRHAQLLKGASKYVFAEYLPGPEYTVDCISDAQSQLLHLSPRERVRVKSGISVRTQPVPASPRVVDMAISIASELCLKGAWFFQVKQNEQGEEKLLEVAPRIAGSMALSRCLGINYPLLTVYAYMGQRFSVLPQNYPIIMDRALQSRFRLGLKYESVYLDLDDTLVVRERVNLKMIALVYQWVASGIGVKLITRHATCPHATLARYQICESLFRTIIHIVDDAPKSQFILGGEQAIFIDDSFRERLDVSQRHGIPVFDVDGAEQLIDWRS